MFYHCINRIVERRFALGDEEKEQFRALMRMNERFSGCRVLSYCLMDNHVHLLVEVPPMPVQGIDERELLHRLGGIYSEAQVACVAKQLADAAAIGSEHYRAEIFDRYTHRMHDLSKFMKGLFLRFSLWFNRTHGRTGRLWEQRFKSVIVEDGLAAKAVAAYIDLNPVRAGMVKEPADYRFSSYGEAIGGGSKGNGKEARAGLVRALRAHEGAAADAGLWQTRVAREYRALLMCGAAEVVRKSVNRQGVLASKVVRKGITQHEADVMNDDLRDIPVGRALRCRLRYFTDGAVIGSKAFVNAAFRSARDRFGPKRKDGARPLRGEGSAWSGQLWCLRDLRVRV